MGGAGLAAPALIWSLIRPVTFFFGAIFLFFRSNEALASLSRHPVGRGGWSPGARKRTDNLSMIHGATLLLMVPTASLGAFVVASIVLILMPGPSILFVIGRSVAYGRLAGVLSVVGNALGMLPLLALVALGVGALVAQSVVIFTIIKVIGAGYLVYLGVQAIRHRREVPQDEARAPRSSWRLLGEGFVVGATNPKTIAFFVAVLPQFVDYRAGAIPLQLA